MDRDTEDNNAAGEVRSVFQALAPRFKKDIAPRSISYYFSIDDQDWTVLVSPDMCEVLEGKTVERADCYLKTTAKIFLGTINGHYTPSFMDLMSGKIKTNNPALLQTFRDIFAD